MLDDLKHGDWCSDGAETSAPEGNFDAFPSHETLKDKLTATFNNAANIALEFHTDPFITKRSGQPYSLYLLSYFSARALTTAGEIDIDPDENYSQLRQQFLEAQRTDKASKRHPIPDQAELEACADKYIARLERS